MRPLGVGLVYWPELEPLFKNCGDLVSVLELEPQTLWEKQSPQGTSSAQYKVNETALERLADLPQTKLLHGVGHPVGGSVDDNLDYWTPLQHMVRTLGPAWMSEHLSFNRIRVHEVTVSTGFLLPPRQTPAGVLQAVHHLRRFSENLGLPFAFETGVHYLRPRSDEMADGDFFGSIARLTPCGMVLDLHNLWTNERNGRESMRSVLAKIPLDQVWELHFAGGMELDGYWLDAHSGPIPSEVLAIAREWIPQMPNLGALIYEILPQYIPEMGLDAIEAQLFELQKLWKLCPLRHSPSRTSVPFHSVPPPLPELKPNKDIQSWERCLTAAVLGHVLPSTHFEYLAEDTGTAILGQLVRELRESRISRGFRYTLLSLLSIYGRDQVDVWLEKYGKQTYPDLFTANECDAFANHLENQVPVALSDGRVLQVFQFERALVRASLFGESSSVQWNVNPESLFQSLDEGKGPEWNSCEPFSMSIAMDTRHDAKHGLI
jgi:uncharacterized protein